MGKGLANALLISSREAFRGASPVTKVTAPGFLQYLLNNNKPDIISMAKDDGSGYLRDVKIRYRSRGVPGKSVTTDDCTVQSKPVYKNLDVPATSFRKLGLVFDDEDIQKFERDAMAQLNVGNPQMTGIMKDIFEAIVEQANGLFADVNNDLLTAQSTNFGKNMITGAATPKTINFEKDGTQNTLNSGMTEVMSDAMANEMRIADAAIVGSGLINNYYLQQLAKSQNNAGLDTSKLALPKFYYDQYAASKWGANQFGLFERDAVQFVNVCRFRGAKAGQKGSDFFMTLRLPLVDSLGQGILSGFEFDVQLSYRTCPEDVQVGTYDADANPPQALGRGWNVLISCAYQAVNIPSDSYESTDLLSGVNGTFRYTAANT